jgi:hypothetical protein
LPERKLTDVEVVGNYEWIDFFYCFLKDGFLFGVYVLWAFSIEMRVSMDSQPIC